MLLKRLGRTELKVSAVGFGGIPIQKVSPEDAAKVIHRAEELGVNFIDTARGYTVSEEFIGDALTGRRDKWIIASKSMARTKEAMLADVEISLKNLKTDYIDLYQLHNIKEMEAYNQVMAENGALAALQQAQKAGKIGHIGITAHTMDALELAIESGAFSTIMYPYNIVENQAEKLFERAKKLDIGVIAMKPMAGGALTDGVLAMKYILKNENISLAIPGMANFQELEQNCSVANGNLELSKDELEKCMNIANELGQDFCRRCGYCMPCPKGIDIPFSFIVKAYYDNYDLKDWAEGRYKAMASHAGDCEECGLCEQKCPYNLKIRKKIKGVKDTFGY
jgi:predicted aldo/keto reductase-like oxidoreductase